MLTSEDVREIELRVAADYACPDAPGFRDSLAARRDVAALLADRAELQAGIERLRAVVEAARPVIEWAREHWSDGLLTDEDQERCGEAYRAHAALAALEGEA